MKILFLSAANSTHTIRWVNAFANRNYQVHLVYNRDHAPKTDSVSKTVVLHELKYCGTKAYYLNARELRKIAKKIE